MRRIDWLKTSSRLAWSSSSTSKYESQEVSEKASANTDIANIFQVFHTF